MRAWDTRNTTGSTQPTAISIICLTARHASNSCDAAPKPDTARNVRHDFRQKPGDNGDAGTCRLAVPPANLRELTEELQRTLLTLPLELRSLTWQFSLPEGQAVIKTDPCPTVPPLSLVRKQTFKETLGIFVRDTTFIVHIDDLDGAFTEHFFTHLECLSTLLLLHLGLPIESVSLDPFAPDDSVLLVPVKIVYMIAEAKSRANLMSWAKL